MITPEIEAVAQSERLQRVGPKRSGPGPVGHCGQQGALAKGCVRWGSASCRTKINANLGNSSVSSDTECELQVHAAIQYGADTVMDLSTVRKSTRFASGSSMR